jgi:aconitate hydratase 2/2-methylisocitrate dehydratase
VLKSWADAEWFTSRPEVPKSITLTVFKVTGETNTDDLSPAPDAWSRPDIPLHALAMLKNARPGITPEEDGKRGPIKFIESLRAKGNLVAYVGDVVGTGSSRKSATNSVLWFTGEDIPFVPNKRFGGVCLGSKIAPIFYNTMEDAGALPIELDVSQMDMGDVIELRPYEGKALKDGKVIAEFTVKSDVLFDEVRAGGRIPDHRPRPDRQGARVARACRRRPVPPAAEPGRHRQGLHAGAEDGRPRLRSARRQGRAPGHLLRTEDDHRRQPGHHRPDDARRTEGSGLPRLLGRPGDAVLLPHRRLSEAGRREDPPHAAGLHQHRGGVALRPGDGVIHSWLNRLLLPDTVGTGGDSHTRFPIGISFPAGSGLVAFAAATGVMPLDMPESVLVRFKGKMQPGITLRDLVHAIPLYAIKAGLLTVEKKGKKNIFSGRILEIEGLPDLKVEQAFELSDASAERSAAGCTVKLNKAPMIEYMNSNIVLMKNMIANGYGMPARWPAASRRWKRGWPIRSCCAPTPMPSTPR